MARTLILVVPSSVNHVFKVVANQIKRKSSKFEIRTTFQLGFWKGRHEKKENRKKK